MKNKLELINEVKEYYNSLITSNIEIKNDYEIELINLIDKIIKTIDCLNVDIENPIQLGLYNSIKLMLKHFYDSLFLSNYYISSLFLRMIAENLIIFFVLLNNANKVTIYWQYWELLKKMNILGVSTDKTIPEFRQFEDDLRCSISENDYDKILKKNYGWGISLGLNKNQCNLKQISLHQSNEILYNVFSKMSDRVHNSSSAQFVNNIETTNTFLFICSEFGLLADVIVKDLSMFVKNKSTIKDFDKTYYELLLIIDENNY